MMGRFLFGVSLAILAGGTILDIVVGRILHVGDQIAGITTPVPSRPVVVMAWYNADRDRVTFGFPDRAIPAVRLVLPPGTRIDAAADLAIVGQERLTATRCLLAAADDDPFGRCRLAAEQPEFPHLTVPTVETMPGDDGDGPAPTSSRIVVCYHPPDDRIEFADPHGSGDGQSIVIEGPGDAKLDDQADFLRIAGEPWTATRCVLAALRGDLFRIMDVSESIQPGPPRPAASSSPVSRSSIASASDESLVPIEDEQ